MKTVPSMRCSVGCLTMRQVAQGSGPGRGLTNAGSGGLSNANVYAQDGALMGLFHARSEASAAIVQWSMANRLAPSDVATGEAPKA